ncbi:alpha/beta fold hydrolase [Psychrobacter phenylpyruvicus]|uniref:Alpha/beta hydrolase family n=1 Tax=Psychrobacter phenylpyruvicus TaxID=29432 RepID=A0A379LM51_9GAMM|nr:alpha/beta fold hydrolase [Psychrobacter phenylpyruvicus]SUD90852.1 Alpha/beta hydrolase family [Psychrobacter phenylpyruvicus]
MSSFDFTTKKQTYPVKTHVNRPSDSQKNNLNITLVLMTAIGVPHRKYGTLINGLTQKGFSVVSADYPCCGENLPPIKRGIDYGYRDLVTDFVPKLIDAAKQATPDNKIILFGHSLGAHIATLYSATTDFPMIGVATGNIHYKNWKGLGQLNILAAIAAFELLIRVYGYLPGYKIGFGHKEAKTLMKDWLHIAKTGRYDFMKQSLNTGLGHGLFINIVGDDYAPYQSTKGLSDLCSVSRLNKVEIDPTLKGNPHSIWLKSPDAIIEEVYKNLDFFD